MLRLHQILSCTLQLGLTCGTLGIWYLICSRPDWFGVPRIRHCNPLNFADCIQLYMVELVREASLRCNWQIIKTDQSESIS
jgi:hypothetical protein